MTLGWRVALSIFNPYKKYPYLSLVILNAFVFLQMGLLKEYVGYLSCLHDFSDGVFSVTITAIVINIHDLQRLLKETDNSS